MNELVHEETVPAETTKYVQHIKALSFRQAARLYCIAYVTWRKIKDGKFDLWTPINRDGDREKAQERRARVLESVRNEPHWNTSARARKLGFSCRDVQEVLQEGGLGNLNSRLRFAGYQVEVLRPLEIARQRRVVACRPGSLIHIDFKTFGMVRGGQLEEKKWIRGCIVVDSFTSFAQVLISDAQGPAEAEEAMRKFTENAPFAVSGIILTDNGNQFLSEQWISFCLHNGFLNRTTRINHPWSNGKVEALNKTLKYQCFPAICTGECLTVEEIQVLVDRWMLYYNSTRTHTGHMNRGLPPLALYALWHKAPGDYIDKLVHLGLISLDDLTRLRYLGSSQRTAGEQRLRSVIGAEPVAGAGQPLAFVVEGRGTTVFSPAEATLPVPAPSHAFFPTR